MTSRSVPVSRRNGVTILRLCCVSVASLSTGGCGTILGVDEYRISDKRDAATTYTDDFDLIQYASASCRDCVSASCRDEAVACAADPGCTARAMCLARCNAADHACRGKCNLSIYLTSGADAFTALTQCEASHPACASCGSARSVRGGASCDSCIAEICPSALDALSQNLSALRLDACGCKGWGSPDCPCEAQYSSAKPILDAVIGGDPGDGGLPTDYACAACYSVCHDDNAIDAWSCLDSVQWPPLARSVTQLDVVLGIGDLLSHTGLPNVTVSACLAADPDCTTPLATDTTNAMGWVHLVIPTSKATSVGYFVALADPLVYQKQLLYTSFLGASYSGRWVIPSRVYLETTSATFGAGHTGLVDGGLKPNTGIVILNFTDCLGRGASGLVVSGFEQTVGYLGSDFLFDPNLGQTSTSGVVVSGGLTPQIYQIETKLADTGALAGSYGFFVQPDSVTALFAAPNSG